MGFCNYSFANCHNSAIIHLCTMSCIVIHKVQMYMYVASHQALPPFAIISEITEIIAKGGIAWCEVNMHVCGVDQASILAARQILYGLYARVA